LLVVFNWGIVLRTITQRVRRIPSLGSGACSIDRLSISMTMPLDFPDPTGPLMIRIRWSERMNAEMVGGAV
jgi:hypothetical protein